MSTKPSYSSYMRGLTGALCPDMCLWSYCRIYARGGLCKLALAALDFEDISKLTCAIELAKVFGASYLDLVAAKTRLDDMKQEKETQNKRRKLGIDHLPIPDEYQCPITREKLLDPYTADDGYTYEKSAIEKWLQINNTSPKTGNSMSKGLRPNTTLRTLIENYNEHSFAIANAAKAAKNEEEESDEDSSDDENSSDDEEEEIDA